MPERILESWGELESCFPSGCYRHSSLELATAGLLLRPGVRHSPHSVSLPVLERSLITHSGAWSSQCRSGSQKSTCHCLLSVGPKVCVYHIFFRVTLANWHLRQFQSLGQESIPGCKAFPQDPLILVSSEVLSWPRPPYFFWGGFLSVSEENSDFRPKMDEQCADIWTGSLLLVPVACGDVNWCAVVIEVFPSADPPM